MYLDTYKLLHLVTCLFILLIKNIFLSLKTVIFHDQLIYNSKFIFTYLLYIYINFKAENNNAFNRV